MDLVPYWLTAGFPRPALSQTGAQGFLACDSSLMSVCHTFESS